jgi:hypothetical protein
MLVLSNSIQLTLEFINVLHFLLEVGGREWVILSYFSEGVGSVVLEVVFMSDGGLVGDTDAIKLNFGKSLEIIITTIDAESSLVV